MDLKSSLTANRYQLYLRRLRQLYQKPIAYVSSALILTLFTIAFFALFAIRPTLTTVAELVRQIDDQQKVEQKLSQKAAALATVQSEYLFIEDQLGLLEAAIPHNHQLPRLLKEIEYLAVQHNLPLSGIQLSDFSLTQSPKHQKADIQTINLSISSTSSYLTLQAFLNDLTNLDRVLTVNSFTLAESKRQDQPGVTMTISLQAFYLPEPLSSP